MSRRPRRLRRCRPHPPHEQREWAAAGIAVFFFVLTAVRFDERFGHALASVWWLGPVVLPIGPPLDGAADAAPKLVPPTLLTAY